MRLDYEVERFREWLKANAWWLYGVCLVVLLALVLLSWNGKGTPNIDALSVSITVLEIFLVIFAVGGFWLVRGNAREAARDEAREEAERIAAPAARRAAIKWLENRSSGNGQEDDPLLQDVMNALDGDEGGEDARE